MRRTTLAALVIGAVLCAALVACTPPPAPAPSPTATVAVPSPSPTEAAALVAAGAQPPALFGGDCAAAASPAALITITGVADIELIRRDPLWTSSIDNVGGLACEWQGGDVSGSFQILPRHALGDATLPDWERTQLGQCDWGCSWVQESDALWIGGYATDLPERGRAEADRMGAAISAHIAERMGDAEPEWRRDREKWWPVVPCDSLADAVGERLGTAVTATSADYHDPPLAATRMADSASHRTWCAFEESGTTFAHAVLESGMAWNVPWAGLGAPHDLAVEGIEAFLMDSGGYLGGTNYALTDGVNSLSVEVAPEASWSADDVAAIFAELARSGL